MTTEEIKTMTVGELLERFPHGFSVSQLAVISKIMFSTKHFGQFSHHTRGENDALRGFLWVEIAPHDIQNHDVMCVCGRPLGNATGFCSICQQDGI